MSEARRAKALAGHDQISSAIVELIAGMPDGARNDEVARALGLESGF